MELFHQKLSSFSFSALTWNANTLWRVLLGGVFLGTLLLGVVATFSYLWSTKVEVTTIDMPKDKNAMSSDEIRKVLDVYKVKQERFKKLLTEAPSVPSVSKGSGAVAPSIEVPPEGAAEDAPVRAAPMQ